MGARETEKTGFWKSLLRFRRKGSSSSQQQNGKPSPPRRTRNANDADAVLRRRKTDGVRGDREVRRPRRRPHSRDPKISSRGFKGKGKENPRDHSLVPLTEWPPPGTALGDEMTMRHAQSLICRGAPVHVGHVKGIPHAPEHCYALYATSTAPPQFGKVKGEDDAVDLRSVMAELMTMRLQGKSAARVPWETLEQPSLAFSYGRLPGTVTLNQWLALSSVMPHAIPLRDPGVPALREVDLVRIFRRLKEIEMGSDDDETVLHRGLYKHFLRDSDKLFSMNKGLDRQITDLIQVLSKPQWIDFTDPKNQVVTRFIFDRGYLNHDLYQRFFHQLLLSLELDMRINSRSHSEWAKERLLSQIPPMIQWNIALARRWMKFIRVESYGQTADQVKLRYRLRKRQVKVLEKFIRTMKWPNLDETLDKLRQRNADSSVDAVSSDAMAFFSGLVLPGPTYPFLIMNTLIDIDPDKATDELALLTHLYPSCGFQYRSSYTYWTATCIVGKVLAPTCKLAAGWIGPARPTPDLARSQIARIRSRRPRQRLTLDDVTSMAERSDPLGPPAETIPVREYNLVMTDPDDTVDTVRIERLGFQPCEARLADSGPQWFDATVQFAIDGASWPLRLAYDVSFVSAWPCKGGPHPLFFDYAYSTIRAEQIVNVQDWGGVYGYPSPGVGGGGVGVDEDDEERVLVVEAFGVKDNEVLARAWCAHWGLSAVVADMRKTCVACAIREAYAATLTVVILVDDQHPMDDE
ncbi:uncharacterized protein DNG_06528 [Cephalotrichum gorgonifer]|uniref:VTC domain-containing protein n=1 Tax=Cephalotrichum gorgonifer TaxID=2041049 RepID=A0AAE8N030_9PEZI|nr:uncharacterized protein DNG_06528 [Cephalotrichum gorgonifer]